MYKSCVVVFIMSTKKKSKNEELAKKSRKGKGEVKKKRKTCKFKI